MAITSKLSSGGSIQLKWGNKSEIGWQRTFQVEALPPLSFTLPYLLTFPRRHLQRASMLIITLTLLGPCHHSPCHLGPCHLQLGLCHLSPCPQCLCCKLSLSSWWSLSFPGYSPPLISLTRHNKLPASVSWTTLRFPPIKLILKSTLSYNKLHLVNPIKWKKEEKLFHLGRLFLVISPKQQTQLDWK